MVPLDWSDGLIRINFVWLQKASRDPVIIAVIIIGYNLKKLA